MKTLISSLIISILLLYSNYSNSENLESPKCISKRVMPMIEMPELFPASCDKAYRCMKDRDYIQLVMLIEEYKYLINNICQP